MDNRNLYGFAFFTLILITTMFVRFAVMTPQAVLKSPQIYIETETGTKTHCFPNIANPVSAPVNFATLNLENRVVTFNYDLDRQLNFAPQNGFAVSLNFYTKDPLTRKIATETVWVNQSQVDDATNTANVRLTRSYSWMSKLRPDQNLYVIPRVASSEKEAKALAVEFNDADATPVLLINGKR